MCGAARHSTPPIGPFGWFAARPGGHLKLQHLLAERDPLGRDVVKDHVFVLENAVCHDVVLLEVQVIIVSQDPLNFDFLAINDLLFLLEVLCPLRPAAELAELLQRIGFEVLAHVGSEVKPAQNPRQKQAVSPQGLHEPKYFPTVVIVDALSVTGNVGDQRTQGLYEILGHSLNRGVFKELRAVVPFHAEPIAPHI